MKQFAHSRRVDLLFVDLDGTLWPGTWMEGTAGEVSSEKFHFLKVAQKCGLPVCVLSNIADRENIILAMRAKQVPLDLFVGVVACSRPKALGAAELLNRLGIPWPRVAIIDDDPVVLDDFRAQGAMSFSEWPSLDELGVDKVLSGNNKHSAESRLKLRALAIELCTLTPESASELELVAYLANKGFSVQIEIDGALTNRVVELFLRTRQQQFNKPYVVETDGEKYKQVLAERIAGGNHLATASVRIGDRDLGVQGALIYNHIGQKATVHNCTFSCSIIPFRVVETLLLSTFVNTMLSRNAEVVFTVALGSENRRVEWLLTDHGCEWQGRANARYAHAINLPPEIQRFSKIRQSNREENGVPPICDFFDRAVIPHILRLEGATVLDIGYGYGEILGERRNQDLELKLKERNCRLLRGDLAPINPSVEKMDIRNLVNVPTGSVDLAFCLELLEHVDSPDLALEELFRVVKPGGRVFLSAPGPAYPYHPFVQDFSRFTPRFLTASLKPGFEVEETFTESYGTHDLRTILLAQRRNGQPAAIRRIFDQAFVEPFPSGLIVYDCEPSKKFGFHRLGVRRIYHSGFQKREHLSLIIAIVGLLVALGGWIVAWWQLRQASNATNLSTLTGMLVNDQQIDQGLELAPRLASRHSPYHEEVVDILLGAMRNKTFFGLKLTGLSLRVVNQDPQPLLGARFRSCDLENTDLRGAKLRHCVLNNCEVSGNWKRVSLGDCRVHSSIRNLNLAQSRISACHIADSDISHCDMSFSGFDEVNFNECRIIDLDASDSHFVACSFCYAELTNVSFRNTTFEKCIFDDATFDKCDARGAKFVGCTFTNSKKGRGLNRVDAQTEGLPANLFRP